MNGTDGGAGRRRRSVARLVGVQALYEMDVSGAASDPVLQEFMAERWREGGQDATMPNPDPDLLTTLVHGVSARRAELDTAIAAALSPEWPLSRLDIILRAILRAGAYELLACVDVPARVVINEYVEVAHAFFAGKEPALVNAVLDRLARDHRDASDLAEPEEPFGRSR